MNVELTHASLLSRVRDPADHEAWRLFEAKYRELILRFCRRQGLQQADAEDVLQLAMQFLVKSLPQFVYDPARGRFRDYLYRTVRSALARRSGRPRIPETALDTTMLAVLRDDDESPAAALWEREWVDHHYRLAMDTLRRTFEQRSLEVFERLVNGALVEEAASAFGMSPDAVYKARQRVRARLTELITQQVRDEEAVDDSRCPSCNR
jgi:RNA polymerase sigma-70 factor (ECF subfamily)